MNHVDDYDYFCHSCEDVKRTSDVEIIYNGEIKCKGCNNVGFVEKIDEDDPLSFHSLHTSRDVGESRSGPNSRNDNNNNDGNNNSNNTNSRHYNYRNMNNFGYRTNIPRSRRNNHNNNNNNDDGSNNNRHNSSNSNNNNNNTRSSHVRGEHDNFFNDFMLFRNMYQQIFNPSFRAADAEVHFTAAVGSSNNSNDINRHNNNRNNTTTPTTTHIYNIYNIYIYTHIYTYTYTIW
ncbi:hypothetical protein PFLG_01624 [Plasmodium falciparum RAJ116]|uniref:Uncharacterized protein n=1 Tax=Plasmodium falciparum RAJ116 TaxID=580058 RepID=A0A0L0CY09_PLAFA|nr:hypothetical protein PFLG_01624 [Plasmodium falciparum RAJ116]